MFVQVIRGQASDVEQVHAALDQWVQELAPDASGWLGTTAGVTADGRFIALARFDSPERARRNSERPEQGRWWERTSKLLTEEVTFLDGLDAVVEQHGDPDDAGFVQVMHGRSSDPARVRRFMTENFAVRAEFRPDLIAVLSVDHEGGGITTAIYFTSEAAARDGERKEPPPEVKAQMEEMRSLAIGDTEFLDLEQPWLYSPK